MKDQKRANGEVGGQPREVGVPEVKELGWDRKEMVAYRTNSTPHPTLAPGTSHHPKAHPPTQTPSGMKIKLEP